MRKNLVTHVGLVPLIETKMNDDNISVEVVLGLDFIVYNYFLSKLSEHSEERKKA